MNQPAGEIDRSEVAALVAAIACERDIAAFETLFRLYSPRVRAWMARQTGDAQAAEELMQETMMAVWNKAALFDATRGDAGAWIFTIARNLRVSAWRKAARPDFDINDPAFVPDDEPPADAEYERAQEADRLRSAMKDLPPEQSAVLECSFFDGMSHSEIASRFGLPLGTVKSRIRMAFSRLRSALEDRV